MKKGVLIYPSIDGVFNIGDYIQSLAAIQFFDNNVDIFLERENLHTYQGESCKLIMNGWFMHHPENWPPSPKIKTLLIAFHINSSAPDILNSQEGFSYLKKHEPIGCRDITTVQLLENKGISAYFSGCLTLTLGETYSQTQRTKKVIFVDPYFQDKRDLISLIHLMIIFLLKIDVVYKLTKKIYDHFNHKNLFKTLSFYKQYKAVFSDDILINAEYVEHYVNEDLFTSEQHKFDYAKKLVRKYSTAKLVITSRIHCALPCLGLDTPVIYVDNKHQAETSYCRLNGLLDFFNVIYNNNGRLELAFEKPVKKIDESFSIKNKDIHRNYVNELIEKCTKFSIE